MRKHLFQLLLNVILYAISYFSIVYLYILDKQHWEMGDKLCSASDTLNAGVDFNENQRKAIKKALTSSFSLIQGPPGITLESVKFNNSLVKS